MFGGLEDLPGQLIDVNNEHRHHTESSSAEYMKDNPEDNLSTAIENLINLDDYMYYNLVWLHGLNILAFKRLLVVLFWKETSQMYIFELLEKRNIFENYDSVNGLEESNRVINYTITADGNFIDGSINHDEHQGNKCPVVICGPGKYKIYGEVAGGYGYRCVLCPINHYKSTVGDDGCIPCSGKFCIDNGYRTECIDPYRDVYPEIINMVLFQSTVALSVLGFITSMFTLGVFIKKKGTPVVASSDFTTSTIHLIIIAIAFISSVFPQLFVPSVAICIIRVSLATVINSLNMSFMFVKSQKLLQAFLSKVPITLKEAKKTVTLQICAVLSSALIVVALLIVGHVVKSPLTSQLNTVLMERMHFCDTSFHVNVVLGFIMVIQFACFIQAFRGRHLPSVMNDGMSLVYAFFASIIMLIVMFAIGNFQQPVEKELYQNLTIVINTLVVWFMIYGQKAIRMLLYPKLNTKKYFQEQRMLEMRERVNERMAVRSTNTTELQL
ncbi:G-protein coupled receptor family C group 6 member A-like [Clytia hemisphaerica]|uniref:G-protein coupled receptor family C group 6 member A-like n=1 Tax=Clytia hemisphaerica TaxID=252671 RepID=UPI0034D75CAF